MVFIYTQTYHQKGVTAHTITIKNLTILGSYHYNARFWGRWETHEYTNRCYWWYGMFFGKPIFSNDFSASLSSSCASRAASFSLFLASFGDMFPSLTDNDKNKRVPTYLLSAKFLSSCLSTSMVGRRKQTFDNNSFATISFLCCFWIFKRLFSVRMVDSWFASNCSTCCLSAAISSFSVIISLFAVCNYLSFKYIGLTDNKGDD